MNTEVGACVGRRVAEACGLRVVEVGSMRGVVSPEVQCPAEPLKTETCRIPVPIPHSLSLALSARLTQWQAGTVLVDSDDSTRAAVDVVLAARAGKESRRRGELNLQFSDLPRSQVEVQLELSPRGRTSLAQHGKWPLTCGNAVCGHWRSSVVVGPRKDKIRTAEPSGGALNVVRSRLDVQPGSRLAAPGEDA